MSSGTQAPGLTKRFFVACTIDEGIADETNSNVVVHFHSVLLLYTSRTYLKIIFPPYEADSTTS
jgi:hypothetical protein